MPHAGTQTLEDSIRVLVTRGAEEVVLRQLHEIIRHAANSSFVGMCAFRNRRELEMNIRRVRQAAEAIQRWATSPLGRRYHVSLLRDGVKVEPLETEMPRLLLIAEDVQLREPRGKMPVEQNFRAWLTAYVRGYTGHCHNREVAGIVSSALKTRN